MTAIAAFSDGTTAAIGLDGASSDGSLMIVNRSKRLSEHDITSPRGKPRGRLVIGACGLHRLSNEIVNRWTPPPRRKTDQPPSYMLAVADSLQDHLSHPDAPAQRFVRDPDANRVDGWFLAIHAGRVFGIGCDYSVMEPTCGYFAAGSAQEVLLGAMAALADQGLPPVEVVQRALTISVELCEGIAPPFHIATA